MADVHLSLFSLSEQLHCSVSQLCCRVGQILPVASISQLLAGARVGVCCKMLLTPLTGL